MQSPDNTERLLKRNELILQAAGEGIYGLDTEGNTTFVNPAVTEALGWTEDEILGQSMHALLHHSRPDGSHYPGEECPIYAAFKDGEVHTVCDEVFWRKDGSSFPVEYISTPIVEDGKLVGAVVVFRNISELRQSEGRLRRALAKVEELKARLQEENIYLQEEIQAGHNFSEIVGESAPIKAILEAIETVAPTPANVLITGETGTGKELVARAVHRLSERKDKPLIKVNCASIPRELFESEFFGHVKGAFTGALKDRAGRFQLADRGTLFLDELGEIPLEMQSKLLRVLQEGQFERVGDERTRTVDVRIIAATNRDLKQEVEAGRFRRDLYYRLNVFPVNVSPLRERKEDIQLLANHFLGSASTQFNRSGLRLSNRAVNQLQQYDWPGNLRELRNVIERAVITAGSGALRLEVPQNEPASRKSPNGTKQDTEVEVVSAEDLKQQERKNILTALEKTQWKIYGRGGAAELLSMKPTTLASKVKKLGLKKPS